MRKPLARDDGRCVMSSPPDAILSRTAPHGPARPKSGNAGAESVLIEQHTILILAQNSSAYTTFDENRTMRIGRLPVVLVLVLGGISLPVQVTNLFSDSLLLDHLGYAASSLMALVVTWPIVANILRAPQAFVDWLSNEAPPEEEAPPSRPRYL